MWTGQRGELDEIVIVVTYQRLLLLTASINGPETRRPRTMHHYYRLLFLSCIVVNDLLSSNSVVNRAKCD